MIWIRATYAPVFDAEGKIVRVMKVATDVTARQQEILALAECLSLVEQGALARGVPRATAPDLARIGDALRSALVRLSSSINAAKAVASDVTGSARQIKASTSELSSRTEQQAASLEEASAAMREMTTALSSTVEQAQNARQVASGAKSSAEDSGDVMKNAVDAMRRIEMSSNSIATIISVIDELSFQTNLLALNAGVEAARAGESGRGFTVVASEVRALARRSSDAAVEIKSLISQSSEDVQQGVGMVVGAGDELAKIVGNVSQIADLVSDIAHGTEHQSSMIGEINETLTNLDQVTQSNAVMAEENTVVTIESTDYAESLLAEMARFDVGPAQDAEWHSAEAAAELSRNAPPPAQAQTGSPR